MKPKYVSLSCDSNPFYLDFWEPVSRIWKKMGLHPYLFYVGDQSNKPKDYHGTVYHVNPVSGVPINTQAQLARFHFTQIDMDSVWITSDIDMFPLSKVFFVNSVSHISEDCWVGRNCEPNYFPVCYNYAKGSVYREVLNLGDKFEESVQKFCWWEDGITHSVDGKMMSHWGADERYTSKMIVEFKKKHPNRVVEMIRSYGPSNWNTNRINREHWYYNSDAVRNGKYYDAHSLRPYCKYRDAIENLISLVQ